MLLYARLPIVVLMASLLATTSGSIFAESIRALCVTQRHDCGRAATISTCCCGNHSAAQHEAAQVPSRPKLRIDHSVTPAVTSGVQVATTPRASVHDHTSPPRLCLLDLPTLFACLLI